MRYAFTVAIAACAILWSVGADASDWHRLAYSKNNGAEVLAAKDGSSWCSGSVNIKVDLQDDSPLLTREAESFLGKVGAVVRKECPIAQSIEYGVYKQSDGSLISSHLATARSAWQLSPLVQQEAVQAPATADLDKQPDVPATPSAKAGTAQANPVPANYETLVRGILPEVSEFVADDRAMMDFLQIRYCKQYRESLGNEIAMSELKEKHVSDASHFLSEKPSLLLRIDFRSRLGKYDISKETFAFSPLKSNAQFKYSPNLSWKCRRIEYVPKKISLQIEGGECISEMQVPKDKADALLKENGRDIIVSAVLEIVRWGDFTPGSEEATVHARLRSATVLTRNEDKAFFEYPEEWVQPRIRKIEKKRMLAEQELQRQQEEKRRREMEVAQKRAEEQAALQDRIKRGVEPLALNGDVAYAHYQRLASPSKNESWLVNGVDTRRPLYFVVKGRYDDNSGAIRLGDGAGSISWRLRDDKSGARVNVVVQNAQDFEQQAIPQSALNELQGAQSIFVNATTKLKVVPVGFMDDPWKGGKGIVVHITSAEYEAKASDLFGSGKSTTPWIVQAKTEQKPYVQKMDERTARMLDIAGIKGGMELDDVLVILEDKFKIEAKFDENTKTVEYSKGISLDTLKHGDVDEITPGNLYFKGFFVQTGESLLGLGSPIYSLKQAILIQVAKEEERKAIVDGLFQKFGDPDLSKGGSRIMYTTWGKRITDDRSGFPVGEDIRLPVSALEAQVVTGRGATVTALVLTDDLYLKETKVTTSTIY